MRVLLQRVSSASLSISGEVYSSIGAGMVLLIGITQEDEQSDIDYLVAKLSKLRIFDDEAGVMNLDIQQVGGEVMAVSQFTLYASTRKGNRPSYIHAAAPNISEPLYEAFLATLRSTLRCKIATGKFGADMQVALTNNGPVTIWLDSRNRD